MGQQNLWAAYNYTVNISVDTTREKKSRTWKWWWLQEISEYLFSILTTNQASELPYRDNFLLLHSMGIYIWQLSMSISSFGGYLFFFFLFASNKFKLSFLAIWHQCTRTFRKKYILFLPNILASWVITLAQFCALEMYYNRLWAI